jgi:hypothetical protein
LLPAKKSRLQIAAFPWPAWSRYPRRNPKEDSEFFGDKIKISDDFNAPLPEDISDLFEGKDTQARKKA